MKKNGFTLIELLAVIIILGIILLIAIPSVTSSINQSRKKSFVDNAKSIINSAVIEVNTGDYDMYDIDTTYYIPSSCIKTESGGSRSTFGGEWEKQYVAVTFTGDSFDFYYTAVDKNKKGTYLVYSDLLDNNFVRSGIEDLPTAIGVGERESIVVFDEETCEKTNPIYAEILINDKDYYDPVKGVEYFRMNTGCTFNGKNGVITDCGKYDGQKYIDTGVKLYSEENYKRDYEISFDLVEYSPSQTETQATLFECKKETGNYPGLHMRKVNNEIELGHRIGDDKKYIKRDPSLVNSIKIIRKDNIIYYSFGGQPLTALQDMSNFTDFFDNTLWIGAAEDGNGNAFRHAKFKINNLVVRLGRYTANDMERNLHTVFNLSNCTFNGEESPITNCGSYNGRYYIDTGISLYGSETYKKDYMISFRVNSVDTQGREDDHRNIITSKLETDNFPGLVVRKKKEGNSVELNHRYNNSFKNRSVNKSELHSLKIYRKNGTIYYVLNDGVVEKLQTVSNYSEFFDDTLMIGAGRDSSGNPFRYFKGTLSDIVVKTS